MAYQNVPVICTAQEVYDYCGISSTQASTDITSGITWATWIEQLIQRTAWMIVNEINRDYSAGQIVTLTFQGNNQPSIYCDQQPIGSFTSCFSWDPTDPTVANVNEGNNFAPNANNLFILNRTDGQIFEYYRWYQVIYNQAADPRYGVWPLPIMQIQLEMIEVIIKESQNDSGMLTDLERESNIGRPIKYDKTVWQKIQRELRPYKIFA
jgi:hypothetical protein